MAGDNRNRLYLSNKKIGISSQCKRTRQVDRDFKTKGKRTTRVLETSRV